MKVCFYGNFSVPYCSEVHHANSLEELGHTVVRMQEPKCTTDELYAEASQSDLFVWVHTHGWHTEGMDSLLWLLQTKGIPTMTYHLDLWLGLGRQQDMYRDPYWRIGNFFTADKNMADWLNENPKPPSPLYAEVTAGLDTKPPTVGHYMPAGVLGAECYLADDEPHPYANDVIFVGQKNYHREWAYRPQLVSWLQDTYRKRFTRIAGDCPSGTVRGHDLNRLYASSKVVVGDSLCIGFDYANYWSDRVYETLGRGGFLIHPQVPGMDEHFTDGEHLVFYKYGDFDQLRSLIDYYLEHPDEAEKIRLAGHEHVKNTATYRHRWQSILDTVFGG